MIIKTPDNPNPVKLYLKNGFLELEPPVIMGILNVTPDSFSDGGNFFKNGAALSQASQMIKEGASIIDVGGESTRPGARTVSTDEEIDRVVPVIESIKKEFDVLVSIDTYKERVAKAAIQDAGADIINDISALSFDDKMAETAAHLDVPVIIMHIKGTPENMQKNPNYQDLIPELIRYFHNRIDFALSRGIKKEKLIIDPGIGFGKKVSHNIEIIHHLDQFNEFELPVLIGLSRKSFLGEITSEPIPAQREAETLSANIVAYLKGASILRVHNVGYTRKAIQVFKKLTEI